MRIAGLMARVGISCLLWFGLSTFLLMQRRGGFSGLGQDWPLSLAAALVALITTALLARWIRPPAAGLGAVAGFAIGTLLGYVICWNAVAQSPASGLAGMVIGSVSAALLGALAGGRISSHLDA